MFLFFEGKRKIILYVISRGDEMKKFYNGKYDIVFKTVMCDETNPHMLKIFLEHILKIKIDEILFLQNELKINDVNERRKIVDLFVKVKNKYIHIELNQSHKDYLHVRNFCYFTNLYSKHTRKGDYYDMVSEFIHIDFTYGKKDTEDKREYYVMDKDGSLYIENMKIIEYNMDRITKYWYNGDRKKIEEYKYLIMLGLDRKSLNELSKGDSYMEEYTKKVEELNDRDIYTPWITPEEDERMILNTERHIGYNQGMEQGLQQGKLETARKMLDEKLPIDTIIRITNLTKEQLYHMSCSV